VPHYGQSTAPRTINHPLHSRNHICAIRPEAILAFCLAHPNWCSLDESAIRSRAMCPRLQARCALQKKRLDAHSPRPTLQFRSHFPTTRYLTSPAVYVFPPAPNNFLFAYYFGLRGPTRSVLICRQQNSPSSSGTRVGRCTFPSRLIVLVVVESYLSHRPLCVKTRVF
jgi:hypothetical protein